MASLVQFTRYFDPEETYCAKSYLQSHGIETIIQNEHHLTMAPWLSIALGGYRLLGMSEDKDAALQALRDVPAVKLSGNAGNIETIAEMPDEPARETPNWPWAPLSLAHGFPYLPRKKYGLVGGFQRLMLWLFYLVAIVMLLDWILN